MLEIIKTNYSNQSEIFNSGNLPSLDYTGKVSNEPDWKYSSHKHENVCEIIYISKGSGTFIINNQSYYAQQGDILIYNKGVAHEEFSHPFDPLETYICGVKNLLIEGLDEGYLIPLDIKPVIHTGEEYSHKIERYMAEIFEENASRLIGFESICDNLLVNLIVLLLRITKLKDYTYLTNKEEGLTIEIKTYIQKNLKKNISLDDIAENFYISKYYMSRTFKKFTGYSPIDYLIHCRIAEAQHLLLTTNLKIYEIAEQVGYGNCNYFTTIFRKVTGKSPKEYRTYNKGTSLKKR